ncbi:MAG: hypothetical protein IPL84_14130 [Chitinophagaceae bacterium]|nr:hypothetical protein [Chitinophagaceae bacterium]
MKPVLPFLKRSFLLLLILAPQLLAAKPLPVFTGDIFKFKSAEYKLEINFPAAFEDTVTTSEDNGSTLYTLKASCSVDKVLYMVTVTKHVVLLSNSLELADVSLNSFAETLKAEIRSEADFLYGDLKGREALMYLPEQQVYAHYRVLLTDKLQYQIIVLDNAETLSETGADFFGSVKIL